MTRRILLIEPDDAIASMLSERLTLSGHLVRVESNESKAVKAAIEWAPELVILSSMRRIAGGEYLIHAIRRLSARIGVMIVDTQNTEAGAVLALRAGADDYQSAPLQILAFLARVDALLRRLTATSAPSATPPKHSRIITISLGGCEISFQLLAHSLLDPAYSSFRP